MLTISIQFQCISLPLVSSFSIFRRVFFFNLRCMFRRFVAAAVSFVSRASRAAALAAAMGSLNYLFPFCSTGFIIGETGKLFRCSRSAAPPFRRSRCFTLCADQTETDDRNDRIRFDITVDKASLSRIIVI